MTKINLRPWREEKAKLRQKRFLLSVSFSALMAVLIIFLGGYYLDTMKDRQVDRNNYIKGEISKLDKQIAEIKALELKRSRLLDRLNAIQELQGSRPLIVRNFDELVRVLPDGAYYNSLSRKGQKVSISGIAEDNLDISTLMRNLENSVWFGESSLSTVNSSQSNGKRFDLLVNIAKPKADMVGGE